VKLRGRVTCLEASSSHAAAADSSEAVDASDDPCDREGARFELRTPAEAVRFLPEDPRSAIFLDPRVRAREIEVHGWRRPGGVEILSVYSVRDGGLHQLHYRCDVCNITATAPGPCWCCGAPFELREEPVPPTPDADSDAR
jgi:hypothetical protein